MARAFRGLGGKSILYAAVGRDRWGEELIHRLWQEGIRLNLQRSVLPTGMVLSVVQGQHRTMFSQRGANDTLRFSRLKAAKKGDVLYLSGYLLQNHQGEILIAQALAEAQRLGLFTATDASLLLVNVLSILSVPKPCGSSLRDHPKYDRLR